MSTKEAPGGGEEAVGGGCPEEERKHSDNILGRQRLIQMLYRLVYADPSLVNQKVGAGRLRKRLAAGRKQWERGVSRRGQEAVGQHNRKATRNTYD